MTKRTQPQQQGIALITVLLIVALAAIITTEMMGRLQLQWQRNENIASNEQAYWYAMGAEVFAKQVLLNSVVKENKTNLSQIWAKGKNTFPVENGQISGEITDLQSCFNLNALAEQPTRSQQTGQRGRRGQRSQTNVSAKKSFIDFVLALNIENVGSFEAEYMADALADWLDKDSDISSLGGAEDNDYASKAFPYLPANNLLASVNELRIVESFTAQVLVALKPHVCIIPELGEQKININTLDSEKTALMQALLGVNKSDAKSILSAIPAKGFDKIEDFKTLPEITGNSKIKDEHLKVFVVNSNYFQLSAEASFGDSIFWLTSVFKIDQKKKINVITRRIGRD